MMFGLFPVGTQVSYDDGDVEVLMLKKERWEFISEVFPLCLNLMQQLYLSSSVPFSDSFGILQEQDTDPDAVSNM
jgi:hypothetical protein